MSFLFLKAYRTLVLLDIYLASGDFPELYKKVRTCPTRTRLSDPRDIERILDAVDLAVIWYWKEVLCLQRSAAATCLLKRHGVPAQLVIGAQKMPFKAHAWVEIEGRVVNDKPYIGDMYAVLDRC